MKRLYIATNNIPEQMVAQMISSHYVLLYYYTGVLPWDQLPQGWLTPDQLHTK